MSTNITHGPAAAQPPLTTGTEGSVQTTATPGPAARTAPPSPANRSDHYSASPSTTVGSSVAGMATSALNAIRIEFGKTMEGRASAFVGMRGLARFAGATGPFAGVAGAGLSALENYGAMSRGEITSSQYAMRVGRDAAIAGIGTSGGMIVGGAVGTAVYPGPGTVVGTIAGGFAGPFVLDAVIPQVP